MHRLIYTLFGSICVIVLHQADCGSLFNVRIEVTPTDGRGPFNVTVKKTIERKTFDDPTLKPKHLKIENQEVKRIKHGSIQHMYSLETIDILNTSTESVENGGIRNLPELKAVNIRYTRIKAIPIYFFDGLPSLAKIWISDNAISLIEDQAFSNIPTLKRLLIRNNELEVWKPNWIVNTTNIEEIDLRNNKISKIPANAFSTSKKLKALRFEHNELSSVERDAFKNLRQLEHLGLAHNRLSTIESNAFPNHLTVGTLRLDANKLNFLPSEVLDRITVGDVALDGNPWTCSCMDRLAFKLSQQNARFIFDKPCRSVVLPVCVFPEVFSQTCLDVVDEQATQFFFEKVKVIVSSLEMEVPRCFRFD